MNPFTADFSRSIAAMGERRLIESIRRWLGAASPPAPEGIGDDCAVLPAARGRRLLLTVDPVVYGKHFDSSISARAAGAKLLKRNLSDLAAMGGRPTAAVVALALDPNVSQKWIEGFHRGLAACAREWKVPVVGGDVAQADGVVIASLTLLGETAGRRAVARTGARAGDWIYVTGALGGSVAAGHHHAFVPRLREGAWLARRPSVRAMIDVSDGLAKDLPSITPRGTSPALSAAAIPRRRGASLAAALGEGEDYELLFAVADEADRPSFLRAWKRAFPKVRLTCIGRFLPRSQMPPDAFDVGSLSGYEHLRKVGTARLRQASARERGPSPPQ
jgi:thiamine-monophosphate kinase